MSADGEGFLSRWSRRKAQARAGVVPPEPLAPPDPTTAAPVPAPAAGHDAASEARPAATEPADLPARAATPDGVAAPANPPAPAEPPPTLQDALRLTPEADFRPFVRPEVAPEVRNAALRRLFADPHFNQMDGLDVYIDDYSKPDPLPAALARRMVAAQFMRLFDEPKEAASHGPADPSLNDGAESDPVPAAAHDDPPAAPSDAATSHLTPAAPAVAPPPEPAR
ncbi:MAG: DUF3306 domain-containing protein [Burkholderiaceae bacterium]|nr:DUF3306 domain-containing protein [Burkholderiaceae bacterium]